jgi:hypothetical protein
MGWLQSPMTLVWFAYFSIAELLSLMPSQRSSCILVSEQASAADYAGNYACASMHEAIFRFIRLIWDRADHDNIIALGTVMIAAFTYVLYRSTDKLWAAGERQLLHLENTAELRLRAYIFVEWAKLECEQGTEDWAIHVLVKNAGQTPAYNVAITTDREIGPPKPNDITLGFSDNADSHPKCSIGPGASTTLRLPCNWDFCTMVPGIEGWNEAARNGDRAYVWGRIDYTSFEKPHWLTFQMECAFHTQVNSFGLCANGNDSDEQHTAT